MYNNYFEFMLMIQCVLEQCEKLEGGKWFVMNIEFEFVGD